MRLTVFAACVFVLCGSAFASVIPISVAAFPSSSTVVTFTGLPNNLEVNGLNVGGVAFNYTVAAFPLSGAVVIDGGPGQTLNVNPPNIVSVGNNMGTLSVRLPAPATMFGYGYAILSTLNVPGATTIELFSGTTPVGLLTYGGSPDPTFSGGFAGIQSTIPFDRAALTFNSFSSPAFAVDNIRFNAVPEPSTVLLVLGAGFLGLYLQRRPAKS